MLFPYNKEELLASTFGRPCNNKGIAWYLSGIKRQARGHKGEPVD